MNQFTDNLKSYAPLMQTRIAYPEPGRIVVLHSIDAPFDRPDFLGVYEKDVSVYTDLCTKGAGRRIMLVGDNIKYALKAACLMARENLYLYDGSDSDYEFDYEFDVDEDGNGCAEEILHEITFPFFAEEGPRKAVPITDEDNKSEAVICTGLNHSNVDDNDIDMILGISASVVFVTIDEDGLKTPEAQRLLYEGGFYPLHLTKVSSDYYEALVTHLMNTCTDISFEKSITPKWVTGSVIKKRGKNMREEDFATAFAHAAMEASCDGRTTIKKSDFKNLFTADKTKRIDELNDMIGLEKVKDFVSHLIALKTEQQHNPKLKIHTGGIIFCGEPGTGKTTTANMIAQCMEEAGVSNGRFVVATRQSIIAKYVGHTAPKIKKLFEQAKGGVLFVDEAGFFAKSGGSGTKGGECFIDEAIKEFVRYMEIDRDTTVIFAMYNSEKEAFLELDSGLSSRVSRVLEFPSYTEDELLKIYQKILADSGYRIDIRKAEDVIRTYIQDRRKVLDKMFGNAREMRKLAESSITMASVRHINTKWNNEITRADIQNAIEKILTEKETEPERKFGFVM